MKASNLAAGQDEPTNGVRIARSAFEPISQMQSTQLVLVGAGDPIFAHGDQGDLIGCFREDGLDGRICGDQRCCIEPFGLTGRDDALCAGGWFAG
jgi:hypothetical protein